MSRIDDLLLLEKAGQLPPEHQRDLDTLRSAGIVPPREGQASMSMVKEPPDRFELPQTASGVLSDPFSTTASEFSKGVSALTAPTPDISDTGNYIKTALMRPLGLARAAFSPVTGFVAKPVWNLLYSSAPQSVPEPVRRGVADVGSQLFTGLMPLPSPQQTIGALGRKAIEKLSQKGIARGLQQGEELTRATAADQILANNNLEDLNRAAAIPPPPKGAVMKQAAEAAEPATAAATQELEQFPLRVRPTETSLTEAGARYVGTPDNPGLFRQAAAGARKALSERLNTILPEGQEIASVVPIQRAARDILPTTTQPMSGLSTRPQNIAETILEVEKPNAIPRRTAITDPVSQGEVSGAQLKAALDALAPDQKATATLKDVLPQEARAVIGSGVGNSQAGLPLLRDIHGERVIIRAMKRAADKTGAAVVSRQLGQLEQGYTEAINQTIGDAGKDALRAWDKDYAYGVQNLFGFDSQPFKLSKQKAEDFATQLFKKTGTMQGERVKRVMELLGPEQRDQLGESFLQTISTKSQTQYTPFDPVKWGQEYLSYKPEVRNAVLSPEHRQDLDTIAKTFVQTPFRQAYREAQRQGAQGILDQLDKLAKPTATEKVATGALKELNKPGMVENFLRGTSHYAQHRAMWESLALAGGWYSGHLPIAIGAVVGAEGLGALIHSSAGARAVRQMATSAPGSEQFVRAANAANQLLRNMNSAPAENVPPSGFPLPPSNLSGLIPEAIRSRFQGQEIGG